MIFFQAEDGIRDIGVTGVQTCALPILADPPAVHRLERERLEDEQVERTAEGIGLRTGGHGSVGWRFFCRRRDEAAGFTCSRQEKRWYGRAPAGTRCAGRKTRPRPPGPAPRTKSSRTIARKETERADGPRGLHSLFPSLLAPSVFTRRRWDRPSGRCSIASHA